MVAYCILAILFAEVGGAAPDVSIGHDKRGSINIPLIDGIEELGEREQIIHEAFKRKCDEVNQTGCASSEQKKMKIEVAAGSRPLIEPVQLTCEFSLPFSLCWYFYKNLESR